MPVPLTIESIAYRGAGVARHEGCVYFVPGTCPGEQVLADVVSEKPRFKTARVLRVEVPSPDRLASPDCVIPTRAGGASVVPGCVYGHAAYPAEVAYKQEQFLSFLTRQGGVADAAGVVQPPFASPTPLHYRNKITLHAGRAEDGASVLGYVGEDNETIVDLPQCPLAVEPINTVLAGIRADPEARRYLERHEGLVLRWTEADGAVVIPLSGAEDAPLPPLTEHVPVVGRVQVPARGFFQVNPAVGGALIEAVAGEVAAAEPDALLDAYCGVGVFGLAASLRRVKHVTGFDSGRDVIRAANANARRLGLPARFFCEYFSRVAARALAQLPGRTRMAVLDPPRAGLEPEVVSALRDHRLERVVYVSCSPDTLSRDLARLTRDGVYRVVRARLFDMFPRTAHFETLVVLTSDS